MNPILLGIPDLFAEIGKLHMQLNVATEEYNKLKQEYDKLKAEGIEKVIETELKGVVKNANSDNQKPRDTK